MASSQQPPGGDWEATGFGSRVNEIVDAVEREASKLRQEAEQDAAQIRYQAQEEARRYVDEARRQSEALVAERAREIHELSDQLMARAQEVLERLDYAVPVKAGFENLVRALGETAERLATQDYSQYAPPAWEQGRAEPTPAPAQGYAPPQPPPAAETPPPGAAPATSESPLPGAGEPPPAAPTPPASEQPNAPFTSTSPPAAGQSSSAGWQHLDDAHRIAIQMAAAGSTRGEVEAHLAHAPAPARASVLDEIFGAGSPAETRVPWATPPQ
jgi:hypothetical protein